MPTKTIPQVLSSMKRGTGGGNIFNAKQVKPYLDKELQVVADAIKDYMFSLLDSSGRHNIRRDQSGLYQNTKVTMTTDGGEISIPDYAQSIDEGRQPGAKMPPFAVLVAWIKRYRILGRIQKTGVFRKASQDSVNSAARAIQRAIKRNGIKARPFIEATLEYQDKMIAAIIDEVMIPEIVSILDVTFSAKK